MSDDRPSGPEGRSDPLGDLGDLDWDSALDEWERSSFLPSVPPDVASVAAAPAAEKVEEAAPEPEPPPPLEAAAEAAPASSDDEPPPASEAAYKSVPVGGSVIAPVPRELLGPERKSTLPRVAVPPRASDAPARTSGPPSKRGGLNQLFSRPPPRPSDSAKLKPYRPVTLPPAEVEPAPAKVPSLHDDLEIEGATAVFDRDSVSDSDPTTKFYEEEKPTLTRGSVIPRSAPSGAPPGPVSFEQERPVSRWLDPEKVPAFSSRIDWLEAEARSLSRSDEEPLRRGRALLAVSELAALVGDRARALALAQEARDAAPEIALAWRQARQLEASFAPEDLAAALESEATHGPTPAARVHSILLAADVLRVHGRGDAAVERWDRAYKLDPADIRAPLGRAALALAQDDHASAALRLSDNSELVVLDEAVTTALRVRGIERGDAKGDAIAAHDALRRTRSALDEGDVVAAAGAIGQLATMPELASAALWLSAMLGAGHIATRRASARALKTLVTNGDVLARRQLAARGLELADPELVDAALSDEAAPFSAAERATLRLLRGGLEPADDVLAGLAECADDERLLPLVDAVAALFPSAETSPDRSTLVAGRTETRARTTCGRLLARRAPADAIREVVATLPFPRAATVTGVALDFARASADFREVSDIIATLANDSTVARAAAQTAAALAAERGGDRERARDALVEALRETSSGQEEASDALVRIAAALDPERDLGRDLLDHAESLPDGPASGILRLEALARLETGDDERATIAEAIHRSAPELGIGAFLAERIARRRGDLEQVLRWMHERGPHTTDPLENALDAVREALLIADREPELASVRLEEAHAARPDDVALRELHERLAPTAPSDRGAWRERRAERSSSALAWVDAAREYESSGDPAGALRAARQAAAAGDRGLAQPIIERAEIATGETAARLGELTELAASSTDETVRRETFERAVVLHDAAGDAEGSLAAHRAILETRPDHKPSLRAIEHGLVTAANDEELAPIFERIARALDGSAGGEVAAHAQHSVRLRLRDAQVAPGERVAVWEKTAAIAKLAATQPEPSLWAVRAWNAHARASTDDEALLTTTLALLERTERAPERAALFLRASQSAANLDRIGEARGYLERAAAEDPGDVVTWGFLAELRERSGEKIAAAEACESLARSSAVADHRLLAWHDAARIWLDEVGDRERGTVALEAAAEVDVTYADVFPRLSALYSEKKLDTELARLLERRLSTIDDEDERVLLEVELARAHAGTGEVAKAKSSLQSALEKRPNHTTALAALADLCMKEGDAAGAEHAYVNLARLSSDADEQRAIFERLAELYLTKAPNLSRAEVALREVLKRAPSDLPTLTRLVDVYKKQGDAQQAVEIQQEIVTLAHDPDVRLVGLIEVARIYEEVGRDPRRSEQVLDSARKEFPTSVVALRAMAEFYARQRQMPAMQILLDRAAADARRSFGQGRFVPSLFQVLHAAFELRGRRDAARVVAATLAAVEGQRSDLMGADAPAVDPRLDDLLPPDLISPPLRALFLRAGDVLDVVAPVDHRSLRAAPLQPGSAIGATVGSVATVIGLGALQVLVSPQLGRVAIPLSSNPPTLLVGEGLAHAPNERARMFVVVRAMKMLLSRASATLRGQPSDVGLLLAALFNAFNPSFVPPGMDPRAVGELSRRIAQALPRNLDPTVGVIALEAAGMVGTHCAQLGHAAAAWANRVALLAVGDPNAALDALAWGKGEEAAPTGSEDRAAWIARHADARDLMTFSVTDAYAEARVRMGLDR